MRSQQTNSVNGFITISSVNKLALHPWQSKHKVATISRAQPSVLGAGVLGNATFSLCESLSQFVS